MKKTFGKKVTMGLFCALMSASMLMGCSSASTEKAEADATVVADSTVASEMAQEASTMMEEETAAKADMPTDAPEAMEDQQMGEISAIDDSTITIALYEMPDMSQEKGDKPEGGAPADGDKPSGEAPADGDKPSGEAPADGNKPDGNAPTDGNKPDGEAPTEMQAQGEAPEMSFTLSGEETTLTITDDTVITKRDGDTEETITLSDLTEGDVVSFTVDGDNALTIVVSNN